MTGLLAALVLVAAPQDRAHAEVLPYAYALMAEGDYYRAIGEFKRFTFLAPDAPEAFAAQLSIGRAYELGGKSADGAAWLERLRPLAAEAHLRADLAVELGCARLVSGDP